MEEATIRLHSLILYKNQAGRVLGLDKKIDIKLADSQVLKVRPKDVVLLHPGPLAQLSELTPQIGDVRTAWELLQGVPTSLPELAELAFGAYTPATAWAAWQQVQDGRLFSGTPETITAHTPEQVTQIETTRAVKAAEEAAWSGFLQRVGAGKLAADDGRFLQDVVALAQEHSDKSRVLRALGQTESPESAHELLLRLGYWTATTNPYPARFGLPTSPPEVPLNPLPDEPRRDLTHLLALAIDDEGNQDPDDALSWEEGVGSNGRLWVHIADVAALVPPNSPADLEARARAANLYLPEGTVPMLPNTLTEQLGLGLHDLSPALSFGLEIEPDGQPGQLEIVPSWVRVTRLTYSEAETRLDETPFRELYALTQRYEARRQAYGAVQINLPEVKVNVEADGRVVIRPLPPLRSRDLVREAMLMTGEAVARLAIAQQIPLPFTTQDPPNEWVEGDTPSAMFARRRTMQRSQQSSIPGPHAGLGMARYVQCTSPLRRYLDLVVHQQLRAYLRDQELLDVKSVMARVGAADAVSGSVRQAERLSIAHWKMVYLQQHPQWTGEGVVVEQRNGRDVVLIPDLELETQLFQRQSAGLDSILMVRLTGVDLVRREAHFKNQR